MLFSGTFAKDIYVEGLTDYLPVNIVQRAAFDITLFSDNDRAIKVIIFSLAASAIMIAIGGVKAGVSRGIRGRKRQ